MYVSRESSVADMSVDGTVDFKNQVVIVFCNTLCACAGVEADGVGSDDQCSQVLRVVNCVLKSTLRYWFENASEHQRSALICR